MREWITGSSFMERFGGQRAGPPNSYRRGFAAVSRFLSPLPSRCACVRSTLHETRDVRAVALDPSWNDDGILPLTQTPSRIKTGSFHSRHEGIGCGICSGDVRRPPVSAAAVPALLAYLQTVPDPR